MQSLHQLLPSRLALLAVLLCTLLPLITSATSPLLVPRTFGAVKSLGGSHLTVFYFGSDAAAAPLLAEVEAAAQTVAAVAAQAASATAMAGLAEWQWATVDCAAAANIADCQEAGFGAGNSWLFTSTPAEGIHAFAGPRTAADIARHVRHKFLPANPAAVLPFTDEHDFFARMDLADPQPAKAVFVKFWEQWCTHCQQLRVPFEQAAGFFASQVDFLEVECSATDASRAFCTHNGVSAYPTLILFDGERKTKYAGGDRSVAGLHHFFLTSLPEERFKDMLAQDDARAAVTTAAAALGASTKRVERDEL